VRTAGLRRAAASTHCSLKVANHVALPLGVMVPVRAQRSRRAETLASSTPPRWATKDLTVHPSQTFGLSQSDRSSDLSRINQTGS
jgi:hypothetical protein